MSKTYYNFTKHNINIQSSKIKPLFQRSNSDTDLILYQRKEKHKKNYQTENYNLEKYKRIKRFITRGTRMRKLLRKDKRRLSDYIINNDKYVKLYGNKRYTNKSPLIFVKDEKGNLDDKKIGLIPLPAKSKRLIKSDEEHKLLYDLQRSIVMMRRFQYQKTFGKGKYIKKEFNISDVITIQRWWKKLYKIIFIQKHIRGLIFRKEMKAVRSLFDYMNKFERFFFKLKAKRALFKMTCLKYKETVLNNFVFYTKVSQVISSNGKKKIIFIQSVIRKFFSKIKREKLFLRKVKIKPLSQKVFFTKRENNMKILNKLIYKIQQKWRKYNFLCNNIRRKIITPVIISKNNIIAPTIQAKLIQHWFKRHHLFICNEKNKSKLKQKEKTWSYFTKNIINQKTLNSVFIKPKISDEDELSKDLIQNIHYYTSIPCYIYKKRSKDIIYKIKIIQSKVKHNITIQKPKSLYHNRSDNFYSTYYISKSYINLNMQKIIIFILKLNNAMLHNFFRKKIKYIPYSNFTPDDIVNVRKIQTVYFKHFYFNQKNIVKNKIKEISCITKTRLYNNKKEILLIQRNIKKDVQNNLFLNNNVITTKPINKKGLLTKKSIINVEDKMKNIQIKYKAHFIINNIKRDIQSEKGIQLPKYNINIFYTKIIYNNVDVIKKIITIQEKYHKRFKDFISNILPSQEVFPLYKYNNNKSTSYPSKLIKNKSKFSNNQIPELNEDKIEKDDPMSKKQKIKTQFNKKEDSKRYTLNDIMQKNKKPLCEVKGFYISKKRINVTYGYTYSFTYNKPIQKKNPPLCFFDKIRLIDNLPSISKLQNIIRKEILIKSKCIKKHNIIPKNNEESKEAIKGEKNIKTKLKCLNDKKNKNDNINSNKCSNFYISKKRIKSCDKEIFILEKVFKKFMLQKKEESEMFPLISIKLNFKNKTCDSFYISKTRVNNHTLIKRDKQFYDMHNVLSRPVVFKTHKDIKSKISSKGIMSNGLIDINLNNVSYITKERKLNNILFICKIQSNFKKHYNYTHTVYIPNSSLFKLYKKIPLYISKIFKSNLSNITNNQIVKLEHQIKQFLIKRKEDYDIEHSTIQIYKKDNSFISNSAFISKKRYKHIKIINKLNFTKFYFITKYIFTNVKEINIKIKNIQNKTKEHLSKIQRKRKFINNIQITNEKIFYPKIIFPKIIYKVPYISFISKQIKKINSLAKYSSFINLIDLFAVKNIQELIFYKLKYNKTITDNPCSFYYNALQRTLKFFQTNPKHGIKVKNTLKKIFNLNDNQTSHINPHKIISSLTKSQKKQLQSTNIYSSLESDFINYLCEYSKYDKKFSNAPFIQERLKQTKITNTNVFSFVKFIDEEFDNLVNGKYCMKCYNHNEICHCTKKSSSGNDEDDAFDLDIPEEEFTSKSMINHFEYDSTKVKGAIIKRKPKIEESYEDPITHLIIKSNKKKNDRYNKYNRDAESENSDNLAIEMNNAIKERPKGKKIESIRKIIHNEINGQKKNKLTITDNSEK